LCIDGENLVEEDRQMKKTLVGMVVVAMLLSLSVVGFAQNRNWGPQDVFVPGEILVKFRPAVSAAAQSAAIALHGAATLRVLGRIDVYHLAISMPVLDAVRLFQSLPEVEFAEPNYIVRPQVTFPNDTSFGSLYGLHNTGQTGGTPDADIDAPEAWDHQTGSTSVVVGVIDTGRFNHTDLAGNIWTNPGEIAGNGLDDDGNGYVDDVNGWNFFGNNNVLFGSDACDDSHGTHVAGTIGARGNNGTGVVGVNWQVSIMSLKFLGGSGCSGSIADAIEAVNYAAANGAHLTNNSWGGGGFSQGLQNAIEAAGIPFIAAAGNNGANIEPPSFFYPCSYPSDEVICVASTTHTDARSSFSNFGVTRVDLGAPGSAILSTTPNNTYLSFNGTSMATPHVSGVAALLYAHFPGITTDEVKCRILDNVDPIPALNGITVTGGRLNAFKALSTPCGAPDSVSGDVFVGGVPQAGRTVKLNKKNGGTVTTTTDSAGHYEFTNPGSGTFKITIDLDLASPGTVSGHVAVNGAPEPNSPVKIKNQGSDTTDSNGDFSIPSVNAGSRKVLIKKVNVP
jgi:subtilisin family serine protease